jgi:serine/threonine-protein kinase
VTIPPRRSVPDAARWQAIQALFHDVADLPADQQSAALAHVAERDPALAATVRELLAEDAGGAESALDGGLAALASGVLIPLTTPFPGGAFGPYRLLRLLGEGGMGVVYLAERSEVGGLVAIKLLRDAWLSPGRRERFALEQRTLAQLSHPGIAQLHDAGSLPDGTPWFVMEYVEGVSLTAWCGDRRASLAERLHLFRAVCEAVQHAHEHAVIHRDLKPSNIQVTSAGHVKLLDFGIAKQLDQLETSAEQTRTGLRLMTPAYAAPEQVSGGRIGTRTDVYSLGVTLFELLVGRLPFDLSDKTPVEAAAVLLQGEAERPSVVARREAARANDPDRLLTQDRGAWADLDVLIQAAMHREPERRYSSVAALVRDVDHFLRGEPLEARPDSLRYRAGKFVRRNRGPVASAAIGLVLLLTVSAIYAVRLTAARDRAVAEAVRAQRIQRFMLDLFQGGDAAVGPADSLRVVELVERGVREARSLTTEPVAQAELYETLGSISQELGRLDQADALLTSALAQRRALFGAGHPDIVSSLVALALLRLDQARLDSALTLAREALEAGQAALPPDHPLLARSTTALGRVLVERGEYDEAIATLERAVGLYEARRQESPEMVAALSELANRHFYAGNYDASDTLNRRALDIDRRIHGDRHPRVADDLINLGAIQFQWARYSEAERLYREGLAIIESWYGPEHHRTASALTMLGRAQLFQEQFDSSSATLRRSLGIQAAVFGPEHPRIASILNELGSIALRQGRHDEAEDYYRRMGRIYEAAYGPVHWLVALSRANLGGVHYERGDQRVAERLFREAIAGFSQTQGPEHQNTAIVRIRLGRALLAGGRAAEAIEEVEAGYQLLRPQVSPGAPWLQRARVALAEAHGRLGQETEAARWRAEHADSGRSAQVASRP